MKKKGFMRSKNLFYLPDSLLFFSFWLIQFQLFAQTVSFTAESNAQEVVVGNAFLITFRLDNADIRNIDFPDFDKAGFKVLQGPYNETKYSNINGKKSTSESYVFELSPQKTGELTIGTAKVMTSKGKMMKSKPLTVRAVKSNAAIFEEGGNSGLPAKFAGKVLFRMVANKKEAVIGEQIEVDFKLYTQIDLMNIEFAKEPEFKGFSNKYKPVNSYEAQIEVVNGRQYAVKTIYSAYIYPQKAGKLQVNAATVNIMPGNYSYNSNSYPAMYPLSSNKLSIDVISLNKTPKYFSGAIGNFDMRVETDKTNISTDNIIKLDVTISGDGDPGKINEVKIIYPKHQTEPFETFPPKVNNLFQYPVYGENPWQDIKNFQYKLNPLMTGEIEIKPTFIYFDSKKREFVTLDTTIKVKVTQGNRKLVSSNDKIDREEHKIKYSFTNIIHKAIWTSAQKPIFGSLIFWIVTSIPFVILAILFSARFYFKRRWILAEQKKQENKADIDLNENMIKVKSYLDEGNQQAFYQNLSESLISYFCAKLNIQAGDFSNKTLSDNLFSNNVDESNVKRLLNVLNICEQAVYAAQNNDAEMQRIHSESKDLLNYYTAFFKKLKLQNN